jgi:hypothetical protein
MFLAQPLCTLMHHNHVGQTVDITDAETSGPYGIGY